MIFEVCVADVRGSTSQDQGWDVITMANGDKVSSRIPDHQDEGQHA
jgi:hypothetical protein